MSRLIYCENLHWKLPVECGGWGMTALTAVPLAGLCVVLVHHWQIHEACWQALEDLQAHPERYECLRYPTRHPRKHRLIARMLGGIARRLKRGRAPVLPPGTPPCPPSAGA